MSKNRIIKLVMTVAVLGIVGQGIWLWFFCRFYVHPGYMAVVVSKQGRALDAGQILAEDDQKGVRENVLGEGRHFLNPVLYDWEFHPCIQIPPGKVGLVTTKFGEDLPRGEFLADQGQKGIWRRVLGPGTYRINPYGYKVQEIPAVSIPIGYSGVMTSLSGEQTPEGVFAGPNEKGVREDILQPGLYYVNPREYKVDVLEIGVNQVSLLKKGARVFTKNQLQVDNQAIEGLNQETLQRQQRKRLSYLEENADLFSSRRSTDQPQKKQRRGTYKPNTAKQQMEQELKRVPEKYKLAEDMASLGLNQVLEFPSRDGFQISLDMTVEFELPPNQIAWIFRTYGDLPAVLDKVIIPQITSIARNKGSEYGAKDFVVGEGREKFQDDLTEALQEELKRMNILVHNALIRHVEVPMQILTQIQQAGIAIEQDLTNKERQNTAKKLAELNTEQTLIDQRKQQVLEETKKIVAEIKADQEKQVAEIQAEAQKLVAEIRKETSGIQAENVRILARADAEAFERVEGEKAEGLRLKASAIGNPMAYNLYRFAETLNPEIKLQVLHAGDGTLWTDLEKAGPASLGGAEQLKK